VKDRNFSIPDRWLQAVKGRTLYYPSAWKDYADVLAAFSSYIDEFVFCDIHYPRGMHLEHALTLQDGFKLLSKTISGDPRSTMMTVGDHREIEPANLTEFYERVRDKRKFSIRRRRGFGQYGLLEFPSRSLSIFLHRGDSQVESGSNVFYLADLDARHEPCGHLQSKVLERLKDISMIISDGSNVVFNHEPGVYLSQLTKFTNTNVPCDVAFREMSGTTFNHGGFQWECIGYMGRRNGPAFVWGLTRQPI
jgi:hypothetical protein